MQEKITIEGKEYEVTDYFENTDDSLCPKPLQIEQGDLILKPIKSPTFSVGMRVELKKEHNMFTKEMVYRLQKSDDCLYDFKIIRDDGSAHYFTSNFLAEYFTPYEKPKEGEDIWVIDINLVKPIHSQRWDNDEIDKNLWNLGLAFKEKKQAKFARERLSKLF